MMTSRAFWSGRDRRPITGALILVAALLGLSAPVQAEEGVPGFTKSFNPANVGPGSSTKLIFTIQNFSGGPVTDLAFSDTMPAGLTIASPAGAQTSCPDGTVTAPAGGTTVSLSGGRAGDNVTCTVSVNLKTSTPGMFVNTTGDLTSSAGNSGSDAATLTVDAALPGVSKAFTPNAVPLGAASRLKITFNNEANPDPVQVSLQLTDQLPSGLKVATPANLSHTCGGFASITAPPGATTISMGLNSFVGAPPAIAANSSCKVEVDVTPTALAIYENVTANLLYDTQSGGTPIGFATASLVVVRSTLNKVFLNDPVIPGSTVDLQFTIQNPSRTEAATAISFTDPLPAGLTLASGPVPDPPCGAGSSLSGTTTLALVGGTLPAEGSCTFTVTLNIPADAASGDYTNTTSAITASIGGAGFVGNAATDVLTIKYIPIIAKQFLTNPVGAGGTTVLRFTVTNPDPTLAMTDIAFTDIFNDVTPTASVVPTNPVCTTGTAIYTPFQGSGSFNTPAQLTVSGGSLAAGASCTIDITLDVVTGAASGTYPNVTSAISATLDGETVEGFPATDDLTIEGGPTLNKEFTNDPALPNGTVDLKFTMSHSEFAADQAGGIGFTDSLAFMPGLVATGLPAAGCNGTVSTPDAGVTIVLTDAKLDPGTSCEFTTTLSVPASPTPGSHTNTTSIVTATVGGLAVTSNPATDDLQIAGLTLTKEFTDDPVLPGDPVTLKFTLDNQHPTLEAADIFFTDDLSSVIGGMAAVAPLPVTPCGGTVGGTTFLVFSGGSVAADSSCSFEVTVNVPPGAAVDDYLNATSTVSSSQGQAAAATDLLVVELPLAPIITKEFTNDPVEVGQEVTLKFTLNNPNDVELLDDVTFFDDLDAALTDLAATAVTSNTCGGMGPSFPASLFDYTAPTLAPGATCEIVLTLLVPATALPGSYLNATSAPQGVFNGGVAGPFTLVGLAATDTLGVVAVGEAPKDGLAILPAPCVVYDSIAAGDGALAPAAIRTVQASGPLTNQGGAGTCIPTAATGAVVTISAINPQALGNLRLWEAGVLPAGGVVNYTANGLNNSNTVSVPLSATGALDVAANFGATDVRIVVVGFYAPGSRLSYFPLNPCAVADSRTGTGAFAGPYAAGASYPDIDVVAGTSAAQGGGTDCGVPSGADAVVVNVIAIGAEGGSGGLAVGKGGTEPTENTTNFAPIGLNNAASAYALLNGEAIALNITGAGTTHVRVVVVGYLDDGGNEYTTVTPCTAFDSRTTIPSDPNVPTGVFAGKRIAGATGLTTYKVAGAIPVAQGGEASCAVPDGARAVLINLVGIDANQVGNFKASSSGAVASGGVVNFEELNPPMNNSNAVVIPLSALGELDLFVNSPENLGLPTVHARGVILGYYI